MAKLKTMFTLEQMEGMGLFDSEYTIRIIGERPKYKPYVVIGGSPGKDLFIKDADLEKLAVNILKALKSKHLKP
jgi:hypothetical protein